MILFPPFSTVVSLISHSPCCPCMLAGRFPAWRILLLLGLRMPSNLWWNVSGLFLEKSFGGVGMLIEAIFSHTQHRAHHSQTRVCARLIGLPYAQLGERREFGRRGGFDEVAR